MLKRLGFKPKIPCSGFNLLKELGFSQREIEKPAT